MAECRTKEIEIFILIDGDGDFGVGEHEESAKDDYKDNISVGFEENIGSGSGYRFYKIVAKLPLPFIREVMIDIKELPEAIEVSGEQVTA